MENNITYRSKTKVVKIFEAIIPVIMAGILGISPELFEAAEVDGATQWQTLRLVIIPELMPGILSALMLTFTLSVDDYLISAFNVDSSIQTLPMVIYSQTKLGVNPKLNALTTILFIVIFLIF